MSDIALSATNPRATLTEDWAALIVGALVVALALAGLGGTDLLGWVVSTSVWMHIASALKPAAKTYASLGGIGSLLCTYLALLAVLTATGVAMGFEAGRFALRFTAAFFIAYVAWILGSWAHFAVVLPADYTKLGFGGSLRLTNEGGLVGGLIASLGIACVFPRVRLVVQAPRRTAPDA